MENRLENGIMKFRLTGTNYVKLRVIQLLLLSYVLACLKVGKSKYDRLVSNMENNLLKNSTIIIKFYNYRNFSLLGTKTSITSTSVFPLLSNSMR